MPGVRASMPVLNGAHRHIADGAQCETENAPLSRTPDGRRGLSPAAARGPRCIGAPPARGRLPPRGGSARAHAGSGMRPCTQGTQGCLRSSCLRGPRSDGCGWAARVVPPPSPPPPPATTAAPAPAPSSARSRGCCSCTDGCRRCRLQLPGSGFPSGSGSGLFLRALSPGFAPAAAALRRRLRLRPPVGDAPTPTAAAAA